MAHTFTLELSNWPKKAILHIGQQANFEMYQILTCFRKKITRLQFALLYLWYFNSIKMGNPTMNMWPLTISIGKTRN